MADAVPRAEPRGFPLPEGVRSRARGALLGQLAGDALGTTVEFQGPESIRQRYPDGLREIVGGGPFRVLPGQVTDDSELALALARALRAAGRYDPDTVAGAYLDWYASGPFDIGGTIGQAFRGGVAPGLDAASKVLGRTNAHSQANGSLMRICPLAIFGWDLRPERLASLAAFDARLSHPHPVCQDAAVAFTHAIALAIRAGGSGREVHDATIAFAHTQGLHPDVLTELEAAREGPPSDFVRNMGWVRIALRNAFHQARSAPDLETGLVETVAGGGDTDTNGCIAGALLGAIHGQAGVPERWQATVLDCVTDRGPTYQCDDALELSDALVRAGARPAAKEVVLLSEPPRPAPRLDWSESTDALSSNSDLSGELENFSDDLLDSTSDGDSLPGQQELF